MSIISNAVSSGLPESFSQIENKVLTFDFFSGFGIISLEVDKVGRGVLKLSTHETISGEIKDYELTIVRWSPEMLHLTEFNHYPHLQKSLQTFEQAHDFFNTMNTSLANARVSGEKIEINGIRKYTTAKYPSLW